ncbi:MAG: hypothetical protein K8R59_12370 [Thermoanaerobaculales bacterium]|nr:hypothetical protein [Thermoanaerobaculales bacterium]
MSHPDAAGVDSGHGAGETYSFAVAGIGIRIRTQGSSFRREPRRQEFETVVQDPDIGLRVGRRELGAESPGELVFDSGMVWRLYDEEGERVFRFFSPQSGAVPYKELRVGRDYREGEIVLHEPWQGVELPDPLEYPLDELLVVHRLGQGLGVELHGCGIVDEAGLGWLFVGHSGAGKSTLAALWAERDVTVLSDDRIILRKTDAGIRMFGTPWHGEAGFAVATSAPLAGILIVEHGRGNDIEILTPISTVSELMARAFVPFHEPEALETAIDVLGVAAAGLPCCRFRFTPDSSAIDHLSSWMRTVTDA